MSIITNKIANFIKNKKFKNDFDRNNFDIFVSNFFLEISHLDFVNYSDEDLFNAAISGFNFLQNRNLNQSKIRIFNPSLDNNGFDSRFTFIEIVNKDIPFLVDSIVGYLDKNSVEIENVIHPTYKITRKEDGSIDKISFSNKERNESFIQLHINKINNEVEIKDFANGLSQLIETINLVVNDWPKMLEMIKGSLINIDNIANFVKNDSYISEIKDFISWVIDGNFVLLGIKEFDIKKDKDKYVLNGVDNGDLGIFSSPHDEMRPGVINSTPQEIADSVKNPYIIEILKSRYRSKVHRIANAERIRIQKFSNDGKVIGEFRIIGLFTSSAYNQSVTSIPLVRRKVDKVINDSGYIKGSHNYKDLVTALEFYPRDELFQIDHDDLLKNAIGIVSICGRSKVKFFARKDKFGRFVSCLIFTPKDRSSSELRSKIKAHLSEIYNGEVADFFVQINDTNLVRIHIIIRTHNDIPHIDELKVEKDIDKMTRIWVDDLLDAIKSGFGDHNSLEIFTRYKNAFSVSYKNRFNPLRAAIDIKYIEKSLSENKSIFKIFKACEGLSEDIIELKIYNPDNEIGLSKIMPVLDSFGFEVIKEHTYTVEINKESKTRERKMVWVNYFNLRFSNINNKFSYKFRVNFEKIISLIWQNVTQCGELNRLAISSDLNWKQIYMLRAYMHYLYQINFKFNKSYIADTLVKYHEITNNIVRLFEVKFNPSLELKNKERSNKISDLSQTIKSQLEKVSDVAEDNVISGFFGCVNATLRTNYYQVKKDGGFKGYLSFKFNSSQVPNLPLPHPFAEIFVYSIEFEAIHLRGGKVARGGLRWSDRRQDYRTEVLGLMKAQMTKNAVIVPVGSKGGFIIKKDLSKLDRNQAQEKAINCYKSFLSGVLDITDNVIDGKVKHPDNVLIYDSADPYLVVAADKGTATFSDIANSVSKEYNFWLGDAFASGGSCGYDHKKMGITAKGAWVSVMRHFSEMGHDSQKQDFTCAGIGDMFGDVFGNGMLLSKHIRLVAAFNHMHIFLDPNPDSASSYEERKRLFNLERSTWMDYDKSMISKGGGIFSRSDKSIKISPQIAEILNIEDESLSPNQLIKAILKAPVDLLWNGGIGTYIKSELESDLEVGDKSNDAVRVNGNELRCKIFGEGGNLGATQLGRIEYAINGGRLNTDAMDNSAGVDCSDHEVNIKIAFSQAIANNKIDYAKRNKILEQMTGEVSDLVLRDNKMQTQAISIANSLGYIVLGDQAKFLDRLEQNGFLNREIEFLPSSKTIDRRQIDKIGMTRPELCVMLSYSKMYIYNKLLNSDLVQDEYFTKYLLGYFPNVMQKEFIDEIKSHQLRKEIITTQVTNIIVDRAGMMFVDQISQETGFGVSEVVKCFIIATESFGLHEIWKEIESLNGETDSNSIHEMFLDSIRLLERSVKWLLKRQNNNSIDDEIKKYKKTADDLFGFLDLVLAKAAKQDFNNKVNNLTERNIPNKLARKIAAMDPIASTFDIWELSINSSFDLNTIAKIYFEIGTRLYLKKLRIKVSDLALDNYWQKLSAKAVFDELYSYQTMIAKKVVEYSCKNTESCKIDSVENWINSVSFVVNRYDNFINDLESQINPDLSVFIVALNRLKPLAY